MWTGRPAAMLGTALMLWAWPGEVCAFSDPFSYAEAAVAGGGSGRWFTGSSADGYGCDACHSGGLVADLSVSGLPLDGYVPGNSYEITLRWPSATQHVALIAELTDELRQGAGTLALPRPDATSVAELCSGEQMGFPSSELHGAEANRQLVSVIDCGAQLLRFRWTAPAVAAATPVWFSAGFVTSDESGAPLGDGVTMVQQPLVAAGASLGMRSVAEQGCSAVPRPARINALAWVLLSPALLWQRRASRKGHG